MSKLFALSLALVTALAVLAPAQAQESSAKTYLKMQDLTPQKYYYVKDSNGALKKIKSSTSGKISVRDGLFDVNGQVQLIEAVQVGVDERGKPIYAPGNPIVTTESGVTDTKTQYFSATDGAVIADKTETTDGTLILKGFEAGATVTLKDADGTTKSLVASKDGTVKVTESSSFDIGNGVNVYQTTVGNYGSGSGELLLTNNLGSFVGQTGFDTTFDVTP